MSRSDGLVAQMVKNMPATWEIQVQSLGREDPLEKGMANDTSILAWRIPWAEEPGGLQCMGSQRVRLTERLCYSFYYLLPGIYIYVPFSVYYTHCIVVLFKEIKLWL